MTDLPRLDRSNPNAFIGLILLIVLGVFVLPDRLPNLVAAIPCDRLPATKDLAAHQSTIARAVKDPLRLVVTASEINADGDLGIQLTVSNRSLGALPIVYQADNIVVAGEEDSSNGFGLIIDPPPATGLNERSQPEPTGFAEADIRLLGPSQSCVHAVELRASKEMIATGGTAQAWYRMTIAGEHQPQSEGTREIFADQGLRILSEDIVRSQTAQVKPRT